MLNIISKAVTALAKGAQVSAATLALAVPAAAAPIVGLLPSQIAKLSTGAAGCMVDLSSCSLGGIADSAGSASSLVAKAMTDATNTTGFFMGQPVGRGGGGAMQAAQGAANTANMNSALAAQRASSAAAVST